MTSTSNHHSACPLTILNGLFRSAVGIALLVAQFVAITRTAMAADDRPNFVVVFIDDMGWSDLSCFGGTRATTENIDRLAREGMSFTNFYVNSPICSPSRVALSTGQYPFRWQISSYLARRQLNENRGMAQWLSPEAPMLARTLQESGYATGHFGKWHMGGQRDVGEAPLITEYGFDESLTNFEGLGPRVLPLKDAYNGKPVQKHDLGSANLGHGPIRWEDRSIITQAFVDGAVGFIDRAQAQQKPFYINVWPDDVHSPFFPPEVLRDATDGSKRALYYAVLEAMDAQLKPLFDRIRGDTQLRENTIILVMSDNGHEEGAGSADPLRGAKTWLFEGGIRSPLIVWAPGLLAEGVRGTRNASAILCALDINRSIYTLAGSAPDPTHELDGEDLSQTLLGHSEDGRQAPIFWRRPPDRAGNRNQDNPDLAVRDGKWKFMVEYDGSHPMLFDLDEDTSEQRNLVEQFPEQAQRLHQSILQWNAGMPIDAGDPSWKRNLTQQRSLDPGLFVNPIGEGADPWLIRDPNQPRFLWCMSEGNRAIAIHTTDAIQSMGTKHIVWRAPETGPFSKEVWAPELHYLDGRWHVYFAASNGENKNHLAYVLVSQDSDPLGDYELHGPFATGKGPDGNSPNIWAIDMTVLEHEDERYALWSGWDEPGSDQQFLYIARMASPTELATPRVRLCQNDDYLWERVEPSEDKRGLNEGPQIFESHGKTYVVYSCGASWLPTYKLGMLELVGDNPLDPMSWKKHPQPVFQSTDEVYGVGHACFVESPTAGEWWHVFHAKRDRDPGWRRGVFVQPMAIGDEGQPMLGKPIPAGTVLKAPAIFPASAPPVSPTADYFGHHQLIKRTTARLHLGDEPEDPINVYRSGEKVVYRKQPAPDFQASVTIDFGGVQDARDAGLLFRCTAPSVGFDAQRGYFAGLIPRTNLVILGKTDGTNWTELARAETSIDTSSPQVIAITMNGDEIEVRHNQALRIRHRDDSYQFGSIGLRVVNTHAVFSDLTVDGEAWGP